MLAQALPPRVNSSKAREETIVILLLLLLGILGSETEEAYRVHL